MEGRLKMKTTDIGFINKNNQKNLGKTDKIGSDHMQYFYNLKCLNCSNEYLSNGSDICQRKCPSCQGGKP
jgi:hypothetical protein